MGGRGHVLILLSLICLFIQGVLTAQNTPRKEELVITTYYPVPYGDYKEMRAERMAVGPTYNKSSNYCWAGGICPSAISDDTGLVIEKNVGIGTTAPEGKLDVRGTGVFDSVRVRGDLSAANANISGDLTVGGKLNINGDINGEQNQWGTCTWRTYAYPNVELVCAPGEFVAGVASELAWQHLDDWHSAPEIYSLYCCKI